LSDSKDDDGSGDKKELLNPINQSEATMPVNEVSDDSSAQYTDNEYNMLDQHFSSDDNEKNHEQELIKQRSDLANSMHRTKHRLIWSLVKMKRFLHKTVKPEDPWKEMNILEKVIYILVDIPFDFLRRLTIPPSNEDKWDRRFAVIFPPLSITCFFMMTGYIDFTGPPPIAYWILIGVGCLFSLITFYTTKQQHAPKRFIILFAFIAFLMSILWIWWTANILIDLLTFFGIIFDIKETFLGITVLAWGNSVGDMMANSAIARKGFAKMAMTGCIAGPLFNLFFGLGISLFKEIVFHNNIPIYSFGNSASVLPTVCGGLLFGNLSFLFIVGSIMKFRLYKWMGVVMILYFL